VITIGQYDLAVVIEEVTGHLETGKPRVDFGGNRLALSLPVRIASGTGTARINFRWDGKNISGAVCGDMEVNEDVAGTVKPDEYAVSGALQLTATARQILASPTFPVVKVNLKVEPSTDSCAALQAILDPKGGVCGYVVDKVDIRGSWSAWSARASTCGCPPRRSSPWPSRSASPRP
jgi:hypothetical protein